MRITLIGPVHPYRGGIASHNARLAVELQGKGHEVIVESWRSQFPKFLRGGARGNAGEPELKQPSEVMERLTWYNPLSWWLAGRRARGGLLWVSYITPYQVPIYLVMRLAFGSSQTGAILHNVLPHERGLLDRALLRMLLAGYRRLICHDQRGLETLRALGVTEDRVRLLPLPAALMVTPKPRSQARFRGILPPAPNRIRLLFFGFVRHYKGLDILYRSLAPHPEVELWVAGDFWEPREKYDQLASELGVSDQIRVFDGYVDKAEIPDLFACCDALVLPYRSGTGSALRALAHSQGLAVIATNVGAIHEGIDAGKNGLVVTAGDFSALSGAIGDLAQLDLEGLRTSSPRAEAAKNRATWGAYSSALAGIDK
ncbi:MAG: hypothetical protein RL198_599 [Actinomycetota bacterium]